ncbi:hypothetical protein F7725_010201 [Dissostichus mawsoni]|uniref:Wolframin n=1 Tax=Dissostichus mawsoni TaxID=36200 RepID=A0A7J5XNL4_DISMA|nr:hypothetical protein F7725_010201 [Dissostichus mawsoni]
MRTSLEPNNQALLHLNDSSAVCELESHGAISDRQPSHRKTQPLLPSTLRPGPSSSSLSSTATTHTSDHPRPKITMPTPPTTPSSALSTASPRTSPGLSSRSSSRSSSLSPPPSSALSQPIRSPSQVGRSQLNAASPEYPPARSTAAATAPQPPPTPEPEEPEEEVSLEDWEERAKSGEAKAQTKMGRYFLALAEERDEELNNCTAVTWLVQAAKQGRKDAVNSLQQCLGSRKGITLENFEEVKKLCTETRFERGVRKAALLMYWKLNPEKKKSGLFLKC